MFKKTRETSNIIYDKHFFPLGYPNKKKTDQKIIFYSSGNSHNLSPFLKQKVIHIFRELSSFAVRVCFLTKEMK